ncbi:hypothetical protein BJX61DRAFT_317338 [Aspergillus egyptiacus]|nr:hypothetical protein BJX61DRAFT_317338 [Aspergillus egyptiacus]
MSRDTLRSVFDKVRIDEDEAFICPCGFPTKKYQVRKKDSPYYGSHFYGCAKHFKDPTCCDTKIWQDEKHKVLNLAPPELRSPRTPRKQIDIRLFGQYTPHTSTKRKAAESFDSGVGDVSDGEPVSPSPSRAAKRFRRANFSTASGEPTALHPDRTMPRRRLFEEFFDSSSPLPRDSIDGLISPPPERRSAIPHRNSRYRDAETQTEESTIPRGTCRPPSTAHKSHRFPQAQSINRPRTESISKSVSRIPTEDSESDQESYGWDGELDGELVALAGTVENLRASPLFV